MSEANDMSAGTVLARSILSKMLEEAIQQRDDARMDLAGAEELHSRRFSTMKGEFNEAMKQRDEARRERDEARRELDEARKALMWIAGRYCYEKTTAELAQDAYEMFSMARHTLQLIEQKEES